MEWCVSYSSLETVDWSLYKFGGEGGGGGGGFTAQVLKICRTPGPTACLKLLHKVCL